MPEAKPLTIDFTQKNALETVLPRPSLLSSKKADWDGIFLEYHCQPAHNTPEHYLKQHTIGMLVQSRSVQVERRLNGRFESLHCASGDFFIAPANAVYSSSCDKETEFIALGISPTFFTRVAYESIDANRFEIVPRSSISDPLIQQIGLLLKAELETSGIGSRLYIDSLATALSIHLLRHYCTSKPKFLTNSVGLPKYKLRQVIEYINENLDKDLKLAEIAATIEMSPYHFSRMFKLSIGLTPHGYLTQRRLEKAKTLLAQIKLPITDIADLVGWSQNHLTRIFRQYLATTPNAYRNSL